MPPPHPTLLSILNTVLSVNCQHCAPCIQLPARPRTSPNSTASCCKRHWKKLLLADTTHHETPQCAPPPVAPVDNHPQRQEEGEGEEREVCGAGHGVLTSPSTPVTVSRKRKASESEHEEGEDRVPPVGHKIRVVELNDGDSIVVNCLQEKDDIQHSYWRLVARPLTPDPFPEDQHGALFSAVWSQMGRDTVEAAASKIQDGRCSMVPKVLMTGLGERAECEGV